MQMIPKKPFYAKHLGLLFASYVLAMIVFFCEEKLSNTFANINNYTYIAPHSLLITVICCHVLVSLFYVVAIAVFKDSQMMVWFEKCIYVFIGSYLTTLASWAMATYTISGIITGKPGL